MRTLRRISLAVAVCAALTSAITAFGCRSTTTGGPAGVPGVGSAREVFPFCTRGPFALQLDELLPPMSARRTVGIVPASAIKHEIEPGCIVPFHNEPGRDSVVRNDDVVAMSFDRISAKRIAVDLGRGTLEIGRRTLHLRLLEKNSKEGKVAYSIDIDGKTVRYVGPGGAHFEGDVDIDADSELPLPFDALIAGLDRCDQDKRVGMTTDGNLVEAQRGGMTLWRSRWIDDEQTTAVDTSVLCSADDARLSWRSASGYVVAMFAVASKRSQMTLAVSQYEPPSTDVIDQGPATR